jgi:imidazolonepropionase-like amidohydrolase
VKRLIQGFASAVALSAVLAASAHAEVKVLQNFSLVDSVAGRAIPKSALIMDNGKITWVGPASRLKTPDGAQVTDLAGRYLMPGLIDLHIHISAVQDLAQNPRFYTRQNIEKDLRQYAAYGVTTVQSMGTDTDLVFDIMKQRTGRPSYARVYSAAQGLVYCTPVATCSTGITGTPFNGGYGGIIPGVNTPFDTVEDAIRAVDVQADKGADFIKIWVDDEFGTLPKMPPEIRKAVIDQAHKRGLRVLAHVFHLSDAKQLVEAGVDGFVHMVRSEPVDAAFVNAMKQKGVWQVAGTLSREASMFAFGTEPPFINDPFFAASLSPAALAALKNDQRKAGIANGPRYQEYMRIEARAQQGYKRLATSGVKYGMGTDSGPPGRFGGFFAHWELEEMVAAGFTPAQALTAATRSAAEWLKNDEIGAVAPGKWGDLLVLDANPLADIKNTHKISGVYIAGNKVPTVTGR